MGIAMGIKGTEAMKEAADIVLADDNFSTIERAVHEGRRIYDNILKSVVFLLPTTLAQGMVVFFSVLFGWEPPLAPTQILCVNLVTAIALSIALAYEPAEKGIMSRMPRDPKQALLSYWLWARVLWISLMIALSTIATYRLMMNDGADQAVARTTAVAVLVTAQIFVLFNSRFLYRSSLHVRALTGNKVIWMSVGALLVLQALFTYAPFMNSLFDTAPLGLAQLGAAVLVSLAIFLIVELMKFGQNKFFIQSGRAEASSRR
ncbi:cation transporting ATPase C-terminal domain-containing protein [Corynebacterium oculi]|nr:cation transporting ATPase C-terminal domain-containing protein [Corynebacterium oculi]